MKTAAFISIAIGLAILGTVEALKASTPAPPLKGYPEFTCERLEAELREQEALEMLYPEDLEAIIKRCYELFGS